MTSILENPMFTEDQKVIINQALAIIEAQLNSNAVVASSTEAIDFCKLKLAGLEHEVFGVLFLNAEHRLISFEKMFRGTLSASTVHPREVVKQALTLNADSVIFTHNHPSNNCEPSRLDRELTKTLVDALGLIDVGVLDHIIVGQASYLSFAEKGLL